MFYAPFDGPGRVHVQSTPGQQLILFNNGVCIVTNLQDASVAHNRDVWRLENWR